MFTETSTEVVVVECREEDMDLDREMHDGSLSSHFICLISREIGWLFAAGDCCALVIAK